MRFDPDIPRRPRRETISRDEYETLKRHGYAGLHDTEPGLYWWLTNEHGSTVLVYGYVEDRDV